MPGAPDLPLVQVGSDAGLLAAPVSHRAIDVAPGERFDVVVDLSAVPVGTDVTMLNLLGSGTTRDVLRFRVVRPARDDSAVPDSPTSSRRAPARHPVHVHLDPFQVLARGGGVPGPSDADWKDTVDVRPGEIVDVAIRFTDHRGRDVTHCHNLEHEDMTMTATIRTV